MKTQSLVVIILRVYALHFIIDGLCKFIPSFFFLISMSKQFDFHMLIPWALIILLLSIGVLIWIFALPIAKLMTCKLPEKVFEFNIGHTECYTFAFLGLGLYFAIGNFPESLFWCLNAYKLKVSGTTFSGENNIRYFSVFSKIIPFIIGLILIFKARSWARILEKYYKKGEDLEPDDNDKSESLLPPNP